MPNFAKLPIFAKTPIFAKNLKFLQKIYKYFSQKMPIFAKLPIFKKTPIFAKTADFRENRTVAEKLRKSEKKFFSESDLRDLVRGIS
jgi:hypothetical protein